VTLAGIAVILLAIGLRFHELGTKPVWIDEAYGIDEAQRPLAALWSDLTVNVPVFFAVLWGWVHLAGDSEAAIRVPTAVASASVAAAMWLIGREIGFELGGIIGAGLFAVSPFVIYWSQEAKPEALMLGFVAWSSYLLLLAWRRGGWLAWTGYALVSILGLYTFYYYVLTLGGQILAGALLYAWRREWFAAVRWLAAEAVIAATLIPWVLPHVRLAEQEAVGSQARTPFSIGAYLIQTMNAPIGGEPEDDVRALARLSATTVLGVVVVALVGVGVLRLRRSPSMSGRLLVLSCLGVPLVGGWVGQLLLPIHQTRYLIGLTPFVFLLAGLGIDQLLTWGGATRLHAAALCLVMLVPWLNLDFRMYSDPRYLHAGWRDAAQYYLTHREPNDVLIPDPEWQDSTFDYYLRGHGDALVLPLYSSSATANELQRLQSQGVSGVWTAVAVYANAKDRLGPVLQGVAVPTDAPVNNGYVEIRRYAFEKPTANSTQASVGGRAGP
jgi:mannosyltransferase